MGGGKGNIKPSDGKQFSKDYQPKEKWPEERAIKLGKDMIAWLMEVDDEGADKGNILFEEFLVIEQGLYMDVVKHLSNKFTSFCELRKKAKKIQEIKITKYGLADRLNANMAKFVLSTSHGKVIKTESNIKADIVVNPFLDLMKSASSEND